MKSVLTITLTEDNQLQIGANGPAAQSKVIMLGMLEMAKAAIMNPTPAQPAPSPSLLLARGSLPTNGRS